MAARSGTLMVDTYAKDSGFHASERQQGICVCEANKVECQDTSLYYFLAIQKLISGLQMRLHILKRGFETQVLLRW